MFHSQLSFEPSPRPRPTTLATSSYSPYTYPASQPQPSPSDLSLLTHQFRRQSIAPDSRPASYYPTGQQSPPMQQSLSACLPNYSYQTQLQPQPQSQYSRQQPTQQQQSTQYPRHSTLRPQYQPTSNPSSAQCTGCYYPSSRRHTMYLAPSIDEDEGFDEPDSSDEHNGPEQEMLDAAARLAYRRSTDFSTLEGRVVRPIRLRKRPRGMAAGGSGGDGVSTSSSSSNSGGSSSRGSGSSSRRL